MGIREDLNESARAIATKLDHALQATHGKRIGFTLFLFEFGEGGMLSYISNGERADMIKTVEEWLARQKAGLESDPLGPRAEG